MIDNPKRSYAKVPSMNANRIRKQVQKTPKSADYRLQAITDKETGIVRIIRHKKAPTFEYNKDLVFVRKKRRRNCNLPEHLRSHYRG